MLNAHLKKAVESLFYVFIFMNTVRASMSMVHINPLVTIKVFSSFFYLKVKKKIHLGVKKANLKFCLDILVHHEDIRV
jgi:hypothetical protein